MNMNALTNFEKNTSFTPYGIVALRWTLALWWGVHWVYKVIYQGMPATEHLFVSLGYPAWFAWGDITLEAIAVIGLVLGLYVRTLSLLLLVILNPCNGALDPERHLGNSWGLRVSLFCGYSSRSYRPCSGPVR
jgi:uncharacterized membrane protein YphA (DoxX/SURF4 family)